MQDNRGGRGVETCLALPPVALVQREPTLGFHAGQPLIAGSDRQRGPEPQRVDKRGHPRCLVVRGPIEANGQADDDLGEAVLLRSQPVDLAPDHVDGRCWLHVQRRQRTRKGSRPIADREADSTASDIDAQHTEAHPADVIISAGHVVDRALGLRCTLLVVVRSLAAGAVRSLAAGAVLNLAAGAGLVAAAPVAGAQAPGRESAEAMARRAGDRLRVLRQEADRLASEARTLLGDLRKLEVDRQIKAEELKSVEAVAARAAAELIALDVEVRRLEAEDLAERPAIQARLIDLYKLGQGRYLRLLMSTADARQLAQTTRMVAAIERRDRDRILAHQQRLASLKASRVELAARGTKLAALRAEAARAQAAAQRAVAGRNALLADIDRRRDLNAQLAGELQAAQQRLQATLRESAAGTTPSIEPLPLRPFRGELDWPSAGTIRARFGAASATANGVEIAADEGAPVHAIHEGTVAFAGTFAGFGNLIIIDHGAQNFSLYGHLLETAVSGGGRVERGQPIGTVGQSLAGQPGLYFELRIEGKAADPVPWLKRR